jgi:hypothetical protein
MERPHLQVALSLGRSTAGLSRVETVTAPECVGVDAERGDFVSG